MAKDFNYVGIESIFNQLSRIPHYSINEDNVATDVSLALGFMLKNAVQEDAVIFLEVKNNIAEMPFGYTQIQRISKFTDHICLFEDEDFMQAIVDEKVEGCKDCDSLDVFQTTYNKTHHDGYLAYRLPLARMFSLSYFKRKFTPVRPSNNSFINALACNDGPVADLYNNCSDEYSILKGLKKRILFSFEEGYVAVSYKRPLTDDETGFPLVPDDSNANEAILSFVKAKIFEELAYAGREGYGSLSLSEREKWGKYLKQFNNAAKMPQSEDDYQSDMESKLGSYPNRNRYYNNFNGVARKRRIK